jgi:PKD repeat protein
MLTAVATDDGGLSTTSAGVTINILTPSIASFTSACVGLTCTFDASSSKGDSNSYSWDFGDGSVTNPSTWGVGNHTYSRAGSDVVTLRVTNAVGASTRSQDVAVARRKGGK